jgi:hypothetical protein
MSSDKPADQPQIVDNEDDFMALMENEGQNIQQQT